MIVAGPVFGAFCGKKYNIAIPEHVANQADFDESKLPSFGTIVGIIMIPLVLIILDSLIGMDEKTTLKTWTIMETLVGGNGFIAALIISFFA